MIWLQVFFRVLGSSSSHGSSTEVEVLFENMTLMWKFYLEKGIRVIYNLWIYEH